MNSGIAALQTMIEVDGLLVSDDGRVRFTAQRREDLRSLFGLAGIDIRTIRTVDDYLTARARASPYLQKWIENIAKRGALTRERQLLMAVTRGDSGEVDRLRAALSATQEARN